jgi:transcriptional regulator with XRE-family HTH domain
VAGPQTPPQNPEGVAVPNRLREHREAKNLTRRELSIRLDVTEATIYRWEMGTQAIPDERKLELAEVLEVTPSELMGWD